MQHHPSRLLSEALRRYEVVPDPQPDGPPSAIRTYIECLRQTPQDATHRLILQDDVVLCRRFEDRARIALGERGGALVAYFVPGMGQHGRMVRDAHRSGLPWVQLPPRVNWVPTVALAWPVGIMRDFIDFAEAHIGARSRRAMTTVGDDPVVGAFTRDRRLAVWATVPSLVEHPDKGYSIVKRREYKGTNPARRAAVFAAD